jgi:hypothetical protein
MSLETMTKIFTTTVGVGGTASVTFSNIPQDYTDLKIVLSARTNRASVVDGIGYYYNGDTTAARYSAKQVTGTGSATQSTSYNQSNDENMYVSGNSATASTFGSSDLYIFNYTSNGQKLSSVDSVSENNATPAFSNFGAGLYNQPNPITSITFIPVTGTLIMQHSTFTIYGIKNAQKTAGNSIKATGGNIVFDGTYVTHTFNTSGTFTPNQPLVADYLLVAGGGGGGGALGQAVNSYSGGGGAGGLYSSVSPTGGGGTPGSPLSLVPTSYTITVGAGGAGGIGSASDGTNGSTSSFSTVTASGGGGGGGARGTNLNDQGKVGVAGGSGGGASSSYLQNSPSGGAGTTDQGYAGGSGDNNQKSGGGGGAGAVGVSGSAGSTSNGGIGVISPLNPTGAYLAGGGGGARSLLFGVGGNGGGGSAGRNVNGTAGTANTGGGGGGSNDESGNTSRTGGAGGSGLVIIRYKG